MIRSLSRPSRIVLAAMLLLGVAYAWFEWNAHISAKADSDPQALIEESLQKSEVLFESVQTDFREQVYRLRDRIRRTAPENLTRQFLYNELQASGFWAGALYRDGERISWHGFSLPEPIQANSTDSLKLHVEQRNNVTLLRGELSFRAGDEQRLTLTVANRLAQNNIIPIAKGQETDLSEHPSLRNSFPVEFNFFDPLPDQPHRYRALSLAGRDSIGVAYAIYDQYPDYLQSSANRHSRLRTLFHVGFFFLGASLFFLISHSVRSWSGLLVQLSFLAGVWILFISTTMPVYWIPQFFEDPDPQQLASMQAISYYAIHAIFTFFIAFTTITTLTRKWQLSDPDSYFYTILRSILIAFLNFALILFFLLATFQTGESAGISLFDLELIPGLDSWILFIATGFFLCSITALCVVLWWVLFVSERDKTNLVVLIAGLSFLVFYSLTDSFIPFPLLQSRTILLSFGIFVVTIFAAIYIFNHPESFLQLSGFRLLIIISLFTSVVGYLVYSASEEERLNQRLLVAADGFSFDQDEDGRDITFQLLSSIEQRMIFLTSEDIEQRLSTVRAQFQRAIRNSIREEWRRYSFDIQVLSVRGEQLGGYATSLDSPGSRFYNLVRMQTSYQQEQIRHENNRPVVQEVVGPYAGQDYTTLSRGWIPVYDDLNPNRIIAWIAATVYLERPDFNKPIRAVLAAATAEDWKRSYYLAIFEGRELQRSAVRGLYSNQPRYNRLSDREMEIVRSDSIAFISNQTAQGRFREVLIQGDNDTVIKASTPLPRLNHHLFSIFRFAFITLTAGIILFLLLSLLGISSFRLFGVRRSFRSRLLDGLTVVTLLMLITLVAATHFVMTHQNEVTLEKEIVTKLDNLAETIRAEELEIRGDQQTITPLARAASPLNADAIFYRGSTVAESTTPQIFEQHLLSDQLPFTVYDFLYNRQRDHIVQTIQIGDQPLLIGYRMIRDAQGAPTGVVSIPTFVESPLYQEQLLETTSYLLALYLLIIGGFVIGTILFANRLTRPLATIREGLNKISGGNLETTIPVQSQDEIGELSSVYNTMVRKLRALQSNLATAEREAAWREMARQIAHEIKNPLTPIKLNLQHLIRQLDQNSETTEEVRAQVNRVAETIIEQLESLNKISSDFSTFAHPVQQPFAPFDLNQLLRSIVNFYKPQAGDAIRHNLSREELTINGSEEDLRRALVNLVKNGLEASEPGSPITIHSEASYKEAVIRIEDAGSGIPEELREKIFTPNFSTKSSGTGLGLAITRKIIEAHAGVIQFESLNGTGTVFTVRLPRRQNRKE